MKFLVDNPLSPIVVDGLRASGHDAVHVRDLDMGAADDEIIFAKAIKTHRIVVSADTDFGALLALREQAEPSVILFRGVVNRTPMQQVAVLLDNLAAIEKSLETGCVVVFDEARIRIRELPISREG